MYLNLAPGFGVLTIPKGSLLDHDYRVIARKNEIEINIPGSDDLDHFPIERARFRSIWHVISAGAVSLVGYGWSLQLKAVGFASTNLGVVRSGGSLVNRTWQFRWYCISSSAFLQRSCSMYAPRLSVLTCYRHETDHPPWNRFAELFSSTFIRDRPRQHRPRTALFALFSPVVVPPWSKCL